MAGWTVRTVAQRLPAILLVVLVACGGSDEPSEPVCSSLGVDAVAPATLSATGLYADIGSKEIGARVKAYQPSFELWSDGADKKRWVYFPECVTIDTADFDEWSVPVGTRFFKEFSVDGVRIETRLLERTGTGPDDYLYAAYQWQAGGSDALHVPNGVQDAAGTEHDIPSTKACARCHDGLPARVLGFGAVQLSHAGAGLIVASLSADDLLSDPPTGSYQVPGDGVARAAIGYLHGNCSHCHNQTSSGLSTPPFSFLLKTSQTSVEDVGAHALIGADAFYFNGPDVLVTPSDPQNSALWYRMSVRDSAQMPPLATEKVDQTGLKAIESWINSLTP